jgi:predicted DNA-binding transcriptional regulator AlpA
MEKQALTVPEFCKAHSISRASFYNRLKDGTGPSIMKVGARTLISAEAATAWRRRMEAATTNQPAAAA